MHNKSLISLFAASLVSAPLWAADPSPPPQSPNAGEKGQVSEAGQGVQALVLASQLAAWGREAKDPVALISAARIAQQVATTERKLVKAPAEAAPAGETAEVKGGAILSAEALLQEARELSGGQASLLALADATAAAKGTKGHRGGALEFTERVRGNATDVYSDLRFRAREEAEVAVIGDSRSDLDCYVYDENNNLIDSDTDSTSTCALQWTPRWNGSFTLKIKNLGSRSSEYLVLS